MTAFEIAGITNVTTLVEVRLKNQQDLMEIAEILDKPILEAKGFARKDKFNIPVTKEHSFYAVIDGNVLYKYVFDVKEDDANA